MIAILSAFRSCMCDCREQQPDYDADFRNGKSGTRKLRCRGPRSHC